MRQHGIPTASVFFNPELLFNVLKVVQGGRIRTMVIALASHFRRVLSVSEIQHLRRLMREGSPERISRS